MGAELLGVAALSAASAVIQSVKETAMKLIPIAAVLALTLSGIAQAQQGVADVVQREANQQRRIAEGLHSGQLSVREAGRLEREAQQIEMDLARALADGRAFPREQDRIADQQQNLGQELRNLKHDSANTDPNEVSSRRLAEVVQQSANQQERIARGLQSGELSNEQAGRLLEGQSRVSAMLADSTGDGYVGGAEQGAIRDMQRRQEQRIYARSRDDRHNDHDYRR